MDHTPPTPPSRPNPTLYSRAAMQWLYTPLVIGFSHRWLWGMPNHHLRALYARNVGQRHLEVGSGNGYWLRHLAPTEGRTVDLLDLNPGALKQAHDRLERRDLTVRAHQVSATEPWPLEEACLDSVATSMMLHCLPGTTMADKRPVLEQAHRVLVPGGRFFGATILGTADPAPISRAGARMRHMYNAQDNTFHNEGDTAAHLKRLLGEIFHEHQVRTVGAVALWEATR